MPVQALGLHLVGGGTRLEESRSDLWLVQTTGLQDKGRVTREGFRAAATHKEAARMGNPREGPRFVWTRSRGAWLIAHEGKRGVEGVDLGPVAL